MSKDNGRHSAAEGYTLLVPAHAVPQSSVSQPEVSKPDHNGTTTVHEVRVTEAEAERLRLEGEERAEARRRAGKVDRELMRGRKARRRVEDLELALEVAKHNQRSGNRDVMYAPVRGARNTTPLHHGRDDFNTLIDPSVLGEAPKQDSGKSWRWFGWFRPKSQPTKAK